MTKLTVVFRNFENAPKNDFTPWKGPDSHLLRILRLPTKHFPFLYHYYSDTPNFDTFLFAIFCCFTIIIVHTNKSWQLSTLSVHIIVVHVVTSSFYTTTFLCVFFFLGCGRTFQLSNSLCQSHSFPSRSHFLLRSSFRSETSMTGTWWRGLRLPSSSMLELLLASLCCLFCIVSSVIDRTNYSTCCPVLKTHTNNLLRLSGQRRTASRLTHARTSQNSTVLGLPSAFWRYSADRRVPYFRSVRLWIGRHFVRRYVSHVIGRSLSSLCL
jgi:hypothetical protein